jgi:hypothetical protein
MKLKDTQEKAKAVGAKVTSKMKKLDIIHAIQTAEGNVPCCQSAIAPVCAIADCLWRQDCVPAGKA